MYIDVNQNDIQRSVEFIAVNMSSPNFTVKNFFGIKRHYTYYDVTGIRENTHETFLFVGKRRIMIDEFSIGGKEFIVQVKKKYSALHGRKMLPRIPRKFDLFNGHIPDAGNVLFALVLATVGMIGFVIFTIHATYAPCTPDNTVKHTVSFKSHSLTADEIRLHATNGQLYAIRFFDD